MPYTYTTQKQIRAAFWRENPTLDRQKIGKPGARDYKTDTRLLFNDFVYQLEQAGQISEALANRVTL